MFKRLYYSTALALLPSTEAVVKGIESSVRKLDTIASHIESQIEEQAVLLAKQSRDRRSAMDRVHAFIEAADHLAEKLFNAVEAAFERRERAVLTEIGTLRTKLEKASDARDAVANVLGL